MKARILALVLSLSAVYSAVALGADAKHQGRKAKKSDRVTILDLSTPDAPSNPLPDIVQKGKL